MLQAEEQQEIIQELPSSSSSLLLRVAGNLFNTSAGRVQYLYLQSTQVIGC